MSDSLADRTREAVRERPFLRAALGAGVVNYTAAARYLDVGDTEAVATALRRHAEKLDPPADPPGGRVSMESGLAAVGADEGAAAGEDDGPVLRVGGRGFAPAGGSLTGVVAEGGVGPAELRRALGRLDAEDVAVEAAGLADALVVVVARRDGPTALRAVEAAVEE